MEIIDKNYVLMLTETLFKLQTIHPSLIYTSFFLIGTHKPHQVPQRGERLTTQAP